MRAVPLLAIVALAAVAQAATGPGGIDPALLRQDQELRRQRLHDLHLLVRQELWPAERAEVRVALAETLAEEARKLRIGLVADMPDAAARDAAALQAEDDGIYALEAMLMDARVLPELVRDRARFVLAELKARQGDDAGAVAALLAIERTTSDPERKARAATRRGALLGRSFDDSALREAHRAYTVAFESAPSVDTRLDLARSALEVGLADEAIAHFGTLLGARDDDAEGRGRAIRAFAARTLAQLLARHRSPEEAAAHVVALGAVGRPVWLRLGISYGARDALVPMYDALSSARRLDPAVEARIDATARLADAAMRRDRKPEAAHWIHTLGRALDGLEPGGRLWLASRQNAEVGMKRVIEQVYRDPHDAWGVQDAERIFSAYLQHFGETPYAPTVHYVRGVRRAEAADDCDGHRAAADSFRSAFEATEARDRALAAESGLGLLRSLAACRPAWAPDAPRPPTSPVDPVVASFGRRLLAIEPEAAVAAEALDLLGVTLLAADDVPGARVVFEEAVAIDGEHLAAAAEHLLVTLELAGDLDAYARRSKGFARDERLSPAQRGDMQARARDVQLVQARAITDDGYRARALLAFAEAHPSTPSARAALLDAAAAFGRLGEWVAATRALEDAVAREVAAGDIGDGHLALAELAARQGRFDVAARYYTRWLADAPSGASASRETVRLHAVALWRALDAPERAEALRLAGLQPDARADAILEVFDTGRSALARRLAGEVELPRATRAAFEALWGCADGAPWPDEAFAGVPGALAVRLHNACGVYRAEALVTELPPPATAGGPGVEAVGALKDRLGVLRAQQPQPSASDQLRFGLVDTRLFASYVAFAAQGIEALTPSQRSRLQIAARAAWASWHRAARRLEGGPVDGVHSARLGAALQHLLTLPALEDR